MSSQSLLPRYGLSSSLVNILSILIKIYQYSLWLHLSIIDISSLTQAHAFIPTWWQLCCDANSKVLNQGRKPPKKRISEMKSIVTDRNATYPEENCQVISQVQILLSNVEKSLSSVCVKMSCVNVEIRRKILPSVSHILYQVETIVSSSSQPLFLFSDAMSTTSRPSLSLSSSLRGSSRLSSSRDSSMSSSSRDSSRSFSSKESSRSSSSRNSSRSSSSRDSSRSSFWRSRQDHRPRRSRQDHRPQRSLQSQHPQGSHRSHPR